MLLIVCPIAPEFKIVVEFLQQEKLKLKPVLWGKEKIFSDGKQCLVAQGGQGKVEFALRTQQILLAKPEINDVICLGCAGSLDKNVHPFDVIVGLQTIEHDYYKKFDSRIRLPRFSASSSLVNRLKNLDYRDYSVHQGSIASGDEDVVDDYRAKQIREQTNAIAVAWEGAGGARACQFLSKNYLEIRGITDTCNNEVKKDFFKNLRKSMRNASSLILDIF